MKRWLLQLTFLVLLLDKITGVLKEEKKPIAFALFSPIPELGEREEVASRGGFLCKADCRLRSSMGERGAHVHNSS